MFITGKIIDSSKDGTVIGGKIFTLNIPNVAKIEKTVYNSLVQGQEDGWFEFLNSDESEIEKTGYSNLDKTNIDVSIINTSIDNMNFKNSTFVFTQLSATSLWTIKHDLDKYPSVTIVDSAGSTVVGEVEYTDKNILIAKFNGAFSGSAYLN